MTAAGIRMLALDVDGTLAASGDHVTPRTRDALHHATAAGIEVVVATGRRYRSAFRVVETLGIDVATVCLGGALTKEADRSTLDHRPMAPDELAAVVSCMREEGLTFLGQRDAHAHGGADFLVDDGVAWNEPMQTYVEMNRDHAETTAHLAEDPPDDVLVVGTFGPGATLEHTRRRLDTDYPGRFEMTIVPSTLGDDFYLEIIGAEVSKWSALVHLAERRGIDPATICAVGDQLNDLSMVRGAGLGVAMGNGHADLQAVADMVCGRNDEDGIVEVVSHLLDGRASG